MLDAIRAFAPIALERSRVLERLALSKGAYLVATLHRADNTEASRLGGLLDALAAVGTPARPVILPLHPRTARVMRDAGLALPTGGGLRTVEPLGYLDMISLVSNAADRTDRLGWPAERGVLPRPSLHHASRGDGMGRNRLGRRQCRCRHGSREDPGCRRAGTRRLRVARSNLRPESPRIWRWTGVEGDCRPHGRLRSEKSSRKSEILAQGSFELSRRAAYRSFASLVPAKCIVVPGLVSRRNVLRVTIGPPKRGFALRYHLDIRG